MASITFTNVGGITTSGGLRVGLGGITDTGNYSEGIRLYGISTSGSWSLVEFGCDLGATVGVHSNQWGVGRCDNNSFVIFHGNSDVRPFVISTDNYVGINTTSPSFQLDVNGHVRNRNNTYIGTGGAYISYNSTTEAIEFNFA